MKITIGKAAEGGKQFALPADVVTSTLVVYGGKGMGKTNLGSVLAEEMSGGIGRPAGHGLRWAALDPMGVWWGLRHSADGKGPGIQCLVLGGPHGDIPIEPTGGAVVADLVADEEVNTIIDFSRKPSGEAWGVGEKIRFVTDYGKRLFQRQSSLVDGKRREPLLQIMDEAARFLPQMIRAGQPELAICLSVWAQIVEEGRNFGLGVVMLTQRSARLNKDVAELADAMIAFRTVGPNSIGAVTDWLGEHVPKERIRMITETVRKLPKGSALVVSPGWLEFEGIVDVRLRETFDSSATPKAGERMRRVTGKAAKPDLAKYAERMKETIERAKESDPAALKKQVVELKNQLAAAARAQAAGARKEWKDTEHKRPYVDQGAIERAVGKAIKARDVEWLRSVRDMQHDLQKRLDAAVRTLLNEAHKVGIETPAIPTAAASPAPAKAEGSSAANVTAKAATHPIVARIPQIAREPREVADSNGSGVGAVERKILDKIAELETLGIHQPDKTQIALMCGYSNARSGGFSEPMGRLRDAGMISYPTPGMVQLTDAGRAVAKAKAAPESPEELHTRLKQALGSAEGRILDELIRHYPNAVEKAQIAEALGYSNARSGGFSEPFGRLRALRLASYPTPGMAKLASWVMLEDAA